MSKISLKSIVFYIAFILQWMRLIKTETHRYRLKNLLDIKINVERATRIILCMHTNIFHLVLQVRCAHFNPFIHSFFFLLLCFVNCTRSFPDLLVCIELSHWQNLLKIADLVVVFLARRFFTYWTQQCVLCIYCVYTYKMLFLLLSNGIELNFYVCTADSNLLHMIIIQFSSGFEYVLNQFKISGKHGMWGKCRTILWISNWRLTQKHLVNLKEWTFDKQTVCLLIHGENIQK